MKGPALVGALGLVGALLLAFALNSGRKNAAPGAVALQTVAETAPVAPASYEGERVQWSSPSLAPGAWPNGDAGMADTEAAIRAMAAQLAQVNYPSLALPDWAGETRALRIGPSHFLAGSPEVWLDQRGKSAHHRLELYGWRGPAFPQKPDRPLVHRWVQIYALFDIDSGRVVSLLVTIGGEAVE